MAYLYTPEFIQGKKKRYGNLQEGNNIPNGASIALSDACQHKREEIEEMLSRLSANDREQITSRLMNDKEFESTYNELVVGFWLNSLGYHAEYEKKIQGLTPDWYVHHHNDRSSLPPFIVEVLTINPVRQDTQYKDLEERLKSISGNAVVKCELSPNLELAPKVNKEVTSEVKQWLQKNPLIGEVYTGCKHQFTCELVRYDTEIKNVDPNLVGVHMWQQIKFDKPAEKIHKKVKKYKFLDLPLIVVVVTDCRFGKDLLSVLVTEPCIYCDIHHNKYKTYYL